MINQFVIMGIITIGVGVFLIGWCLLWINVYPSWMLFPIGVGTIILGSALIQLMKDDDLYQKSSTDTIQKESTK